MKMTYPNWIINEANQIARRNKTTNAMSTEAKRIEYGTLKEALIINEEFEWLASEFEHMLTGNYGEYAQFQIGRVLTGSKRVNINAHLWFMLFCDYRNLTKHYATKLWKDLTESQQYDINLKLDDLLYDNGQECKDRYIDICSE